MLNEERMQILQMLKEGKLTVEEAARLLDAVENDTKSDQLGRNIQVRVVESGRQKVNITIPVGFAKMALGMVPKNVIKDTDVDWDGIIRSVQAGNIGKIVEIDQPDEERHIEIHVD